MAFALTATGMSGTQVKLAWSDAASSVSVYRTTTDYTSDIAAASTAGNLGTALSTGMTGTFYNDYTSVAATLYYYYAYDGTDWVSATLTTPTPTEFDADYVPVNPIKKSPGAAFVEEQNNSGYVRINPLSVSNGNLCLIAIKTTDALDDDDIAALFTGTSMNYNIVVNGEVPSVSGYSPELNGTFQVKYNANAD